MRKVMGHVTNENCLCAWNLEAATMLAGLARTFKTDLLFKGGILNTDGPEQCHVVLIGAAVAELCTDVQLPTMMCQQQLLCLLRWTTLIVHAVPLLYRHDTSFLTPSGLTFCQNPDHA